MAIPQTLHIIFKSGKRRFSVKLAGPDGTPNFRDLTGSRTGKALDTAHVKAADKLVSGVLAAIAKADFSAPLSKVPSRTARGPKAAAKKPAAKKARKTKG